MYQFSSRQTQNAPLGRIIGAVGRVIAPTALLTAILYYFGWARTSAAATAAGLDQSLFGYSTSDYVLRSVGPLYRPIGVATIVLLLWLVFLGVVELGLQRIRDDHPDWWKSLRYGAGMLLVVSVGLVWWGAVGLEDVTDETPAHGSAFRVLVGAAVLWLLVVFARFDRGTIGRFVHAKQTVATGMVMLFVLVSVFAIVLRLAFEDGAGSINEFSANVAGNPEVIVTSDVPLDIDLEGVDCIVIQPNAERGTPARFRCSGLRMLIEANDRFFLVNPRFGQDAAGAAVSVIPNSPGLRIDFVNS